LTNSDALELLSSNVQRERLEGARHLAVHATTDESPLIKAYLRTERIPWIRSALEDAIARIELTPRGSSTSREVEEPSDEDSILAEVYARATRNLTDKLVHELRPLIGLARVEAEREIADYDESKTRKILSRMQSSVRAIEALGMAAATPKLSEFELSLFIENVVNECDSEFLLEHPEQPPTQIEDPGTFLVRSDEGLLELALRNGLKNALEASYERRSPVVVSWGHSNSDYWISVLDRGEGLKIEVSKAIALGVTTKSAHTGMGLAIAAQAMLSLGGRIDIESREDGVTYFEISCSRADPE